MKNLLKLGTALTRAEQKNVFGGKTQADFDQCKLYINTPGGGGYWSEFVSYAQASSQWDGFEYSDGSYASGYCCAGC